MRDAHAIYVLLEAVRARVARLRYRSAAARAERDALEAELWAVEEWLLDRDDAPAPEVTP